MNSATLFFIGAGHGGEAALRSLQDIFPVLEIVTADPMLLGMARTRDRISPIEAVEFPVGVMAGHTGFLTAEFLARKSVLNVHYSLLPSYRGLHSVVWAMLNLEAELGLTVHMANAEMDDGPIIHQHRIEYAGQTSCEIMQSLDDYVSKNLGRVVAGFLSGELSPIEQERSLASWVPRRSLEDCLVEFAWPAPRLRALFLALVRPYPLPALIVRGDRFEISEAAIVDRPYFCDLGRVVNIDRSGVWIKCADSLLIVGKLIGGNGQERDARELLRLGMRLERNI